MVKSSPAEATAGAAGPAGGGEAGTGGGHAARRADVDGPVPAAPTTTPPTTPTTTAPRKRLPIFERFLPVWVLACMVAGAALGAKVPRLAAALAGVQAGGVNIIISVLVWVMIFPMLLAVDLAALRAAAATPGPIALTSATNYGVQPFLMFGVATLFFRVVFARWLAPDLAAQFVAGCVLLGCAPCTAMVFVWSGLVGGHPGYTVVQVAVNDALLLGLYVPLAGALIGAASLPPPYVTVALSVALFLVAPLAAAAAVRWAVLRWRGPAALAALRARLAPAVGAGLLATLVLVFLFQGEAIVARPAHIAMVALPLALQTFGVWAFVYVVGGLGCAMEHAFLAPASLISTSNFFELAVATAAAVYGPASGAALATTVGVLVEVPLMLALVAACNALKPGVERRRAARLAGGGWGAWIARLCGSRGRRGDGSVAAGDAGGRGVGRDGEVRDEPHAARVEDA